MNVSGTAFSVANLSLPLALAAGQSVDFDVTFTPSGHGWTGGTVVLTSNASNKRLSIWTGGVAVANESLTPSPATLSFGNVSVGSSSTLPISFTNTGTSYVTLSNVASTGTGYTFSGPTLPVSIAPNTTVAFNVLFAPSAAGASSGTLVLRNGGISINLTGTGTVGQLTVAPAAINFGSVAVGSTQTAPLTMTASGGDVTINSGSSSSAQFVLQGITFPFTVPSGQTTTFNAAFIPKASGTLSGNFSFATSTSASQVVESLTGVGTAAQYNVSLSWSPSTSQVVGYNVYRAASSSGPYSRLNSAVNANTAFTDSTVLSGQTYFYAATSVDSTGTESAYSALAQAVVP
jgi:hypothetical protein